MECRASEEVACLISLKLVLKCKEIYVQKGDHKNRLNNLMTPDYLTYMQNTSQQIYLHVP